uniref:ATP synthase subunit O, mitochondrial-like n=1 Tax=Geotrypetes seraphini TaxID=260995 RepID=A0A6P8QDF4_GEOSA|nr:ATP synthase subunit O, mitochondrial-like [Geotrypetes seraphini]
MVALTDTLVSLAKLTGGMAASTQYQLCALAVTASHSALIRPRHPLEQQKRGKNNTEGERMKPRGGAEVPDMEVSECMHLILIQGQHITLHLSPCALESHLTMRPAVRGVGKAHISDLRANRLKVFRSLQKSMADALAKEKLSPVTVNVLAENGRLHQTPDVIAAFNRMMSAHRGEVPCTVTTAGPLETASLTELQAALGGFLAKGEILKLETKTDPSILGRMIVSLGDKYIDISTKAKIQKMTNIMRETV